MGGRIILGGAGKVRIVFVVFGFFFNATVVVDCRTLLPWLGGTSISDIDDEDELEDEDALESA